MISHLFLFFPFKTHEEFVQTMLSGLKLTPATDSSDRETFVPPSNVELPTAVGKCFDYKHL
jgi:hypothetical protein